MAEVVAKTEASLAVVAQAVSALESGDVSRCYRLVGEVKRGGILILKETQYLLDRVSAVEKHYREQEHAKSRRINELYHSEQAIKQKKEEKSSAMRSKESDLCQAKMDLDAAEEERRGARRRKEEAKGSKNANIAGAVGFGIATVLTLGLAAPITVPGAVVCSFNAVEASEDEERAERDINDAASRISSCHREVSQYKADISQLDDEMVALSHQVIRMKAERDKIHAQRGELSDAIKYLHDVLNFWKEFSQLTKHGTERATLFQKLSALFKLHSKRSSRLSRQLQSFVSSWGKVEEKLEKGGNDYLFSIDFTCHFCHSDFHSLPHLSYGNFCCIECYTINS